MTGFVLALLVTLPQPNITATDTFDHDLLEVESRVVEPELDMTYGGDCSDMEYGICHARCIDRNQDLVRANYTLAQVSCQEINAFTLRCGCGFTPPGPYYPPIYWPGPTLPGGGTIQ